MRYICRNVDVAIKKNLIANKIQEFTFADSSKLHKHVCRPQTTRSEHKTNRKEKLTFFNLITLNVQRLMHGYRICLPRLTVNVSQYL